MQDLAKVKRWTTGQLREEPRFSYTVCHDMSEVKKLRDIAKRSVIIGVDIETTGTTISSIQYCCMFNNKLHTWVVPFINPLKKDGCHWEDESYELQVWRYIKEINATDAIKCLQNGSYDSAYFIKYRIPLRNYIADTLHGWHSIWVESPKRIDFIASIALDKYVYWKDEGKVEDKKEDTKGGVIPKTKTGLDNYWRYGALDSHNTLLCFRFILAVMQMEKLKWTLENYRNEMRQQFGPAFAMSMRGIKCNEKLQAKYAMEMAEASCRAEDELKIAMGDPNFNPRSPIQMKEALYAILQVTPYGRGKQRTSTDEKVLTMVKDQNPFINWFVEKVWACKKPANNASKYGSGVTLKGRFMYKMCAGVTETGRYASKSHDFWVGTNIQNLPYIMRPMLEADEGFLLFDIDYSQSDAYFTAFESEDEKFIATMLSDKDTHCLHAEFFFKIAYEKLNSAHKKKEAWCSHNVTGVRSITKRVVYGANYLMGGSTLLLTMSRKPVQAAAEYLGIPNPYKIPDKGLIKLCDAFLSKYFQMYPRLKEWLFNEAIPKAVREGNTATCAFNRTRIFFGKLSDAKTQREFAAYFGQGGTAGNINKALDNMYYGMQQEAVAELTHDKAKQVALQNLARAGVQLLFQVHDSIIGQVPAGRLDLIPLIQLAMANKVTIHNRTFVVPTEAQVGLAWGKRMLDYNSKTTLADIERHDATWWEKENNND